MAKIYKNITEMVGNTPLAELCNIKKELSLKSNLFAKLEYFNPGGSQKDRVALEMIKDAKEKGLITDNSVIIEPTSGNTGIGLACICASLGLKVILTMPDTMSVERQKILKAYGAEIVLTEGALGMQGAVDKAFSLRNEIKGSFIPSQFDNPANPMAHYKTTGKEIYEDMNGKIDIYIATVGTGGTLSGTGKYLKEKNPDIKIIAVEPESSPLISKGYAGSHKIQGIGANFIPENLDKSIYDEVITVSDDDSYKYASLIEKKEGYFVGISSGAALCAAIKIALRDENKDKNIVVLLPDTGQRYISTPNFI